MKMRLLNTKTLKLHEFFDEDIPKYAILSHTWRDEEVSFADFVHGKAKGKDLKGYPKIEGSCAEAIRQGLEYVWIDTVCIDKSSSNELGEAINSMFMWYRDARICFVYLDDVDDLTNLGESRWITRGWTLQELIAPEVVEFYDTYWTHLGSRQSVARDLARISKIDQIVLQDRTTLKNFNIATRMSWAAKRNTTRGEDKAYCLMGMFIIIMPIMYGEGAEKAFYRLQEAILESSDDQSILAWDRDRPPPPGSRVLRLNWLTGFLAPDLWYFDSQQKIITLVGRAGDYTLTKRGLEISLPILREADKESRYYGGTIAIFSCRFEGCLDGRIGAYVLFVPEHGLADKTGTFMIRNLPFVNVNVEELQRAEVEKIFLKRQDPKMFKDATSYSIRHICSVMSKPLLAQGYEIIHAEPECAVNSWNSHTHVSEIMTLYLSQRIYRKFGFINTTQNEAFVVSFLSAQDGLYTDWKTAMRVETKHQAWDAVTWLRSKGMYNVTGPSSPVEDWMQGSRARNVSLKDILYLKSPSETSLLVRKQQLSSDAAFSSVTAELKFVKTIDTQYFALEFSLTNRVHNLRGKKGRTSCGATPDLSHHAHTFEGRQGRKKTLPSKSARQPSSQIPFRAKSM